MRPVRLEAMDVESPHNDDAGTLWLFARHDQDTMMKFSKIALTLALAASASHVSAAIIASDDFSYATGALNGANGGTGWGGGWSATGAASVSDPAVDLDGNRAASFTSNAGNAAHRALSSTFTGDSVFVSFFIQVATGSNIGNNDFLGLWLQNGAANEGSNRPTLGLKGNEVTNDASRNDLFVRTTGSNGSFLSSSNVILGQTYQIVGHLYRNAAGNYTNFDAWLNPTAGDLGTPDASFVGNSGINQITRVGIRTANLDQGDNILIDRVVLATTFREAIGQPIPEPGALGLLGLGLAGMAFMRRRRA
ncbi:PEP-CTERM sorting domain-containing protein [Methyloversatilis sp.]|uniref:PEP-CTERM sorting domain-containing protein n=1 Tax=Methyloversatilis sp. TaxID=2569862 RepID=UPI003F729829